MPIVSNYVKILLDRMNTHPEEFVSSKALMGLWTQPKWQDILCSNVFNPVEKFLLKRKYRKLKRFQIEKDILSTLVDGNKAEDFINTHSIPSRFSKSVTVSAKDIDDTHVRF